MLGMELGLGSGGRAGVVWISLNLYIGLHSFDSESLSI